MCVCAVSGGSDREAVCLRCQAEVSRTVCVQCQAEASARLCVCGVRGSGASGFAWHAGSSGECCWLRLAGLSPELHSVRSSKLWLVTVLTAFLLHNKPGVFSWRRKGDRCVTQVYHVGLWRPGCCRRVDRSGQGSGPRCMVRRRASSCRSERC